MRIFFLSFAQKKAVATRKSDSLVEIYYYN